MTKVKEISGVPIEWDKIDTSRVINMSTDVLLEQVKFATALNGWGLICEICKRLARIRVE